MGAVERPSVFKIVQMEMHQGPSRLRSLHYSSLQGVSSLATLGEIPEFKEKWFVFHTTVLLSKASQSLPLELSMNSVCTALFPLYLWILDSDSCTSV